MTQQLQVSADTLFNFRIAGGVLAAIIQGLRKLPMEVAEPIVNELVNQADQQVRAAEAVEAAAAAAAKDAEATSAKALKLVAKTLAKPKKTPIAEALAPDAGNIPDGL